MSDLPPRVQQTHKIAVHFESMVSAIAKHICITLEEECPYLQVTPRFKKQLEEFIGGTSNFRLD